MKEIDLFETLADAVRPTSCKNQLPQGIVEYAKDKFKHELDCMTYSTIHVLPLTIEGEIERKRLYFEDGVGNYGTIEMNFNYGGDVFLAILVNND